MVKVEFVKAFENVCSGYSSISCEMMTTLKLRKNCFSLKVPIQPCRPMSDQAPPEVI